MKKKGGEWEKNSQRRSNARGRTIIEGLREMSRFKDRVDHHLMKFQGGKAE